MCTSLSVLCQTNLKSCILQLGNKLTCYSKLSGHMINIRNCPIRFFTKIDNNVVNFTKKKYGTAARAGSHPDSFSKQKAKELAMRLTSEEREMLVATLQDYQSQIIKAEYQADQWNQQPETVPQPRRRDLILVFISNAIPFIGFGFLDNFIMIIAGEHIEVILGSFMTLSTMAAAALGNTISDVLGIGLANYVERLSQKIGLPRITLTPVQLDLPQSRRAANLGRVIGVIIGCILGMTPLLFLHQEPKEDKDKDK
ncbi:transmembrane protein 65 isoform X3 [Chelonus insularis]|uniref:transmembrane protein 65 isoform X3 n=1 Tax=Chelonus insularis TaxID=460826 RepID=UPI00158BD085|nr:transmembrane protein 65 isoform X3 [Chelonus insularis]